jgi:ubiquinone/menaquinone biosynthesis C-methylase UbiE
MIKAMQNKNEILKEYYEKYFQKLCYSGVQSKGSSYIHRSLEKFWVEKQPKSILEVGAGSGEHFEFIDIGYETKQPQYVAVDLHNRNKNPNLPHNNIDLSWINANVEKLSFRDDLFDRCLATCLFLHLDNPFEAFKELRRVTKSGGEIGIAYPTDPGLMNRAIKSIITKPQAKKIGLKHYDLINSLEHRNHVSGLIKMQNYVFRNDLVKNHYLPFRIPSWNANLLVISHIKVVK